jgi:RecA/RadA recombinase
MEAQASEDKPPIQTRLCFLDAFLRGGIPHSSITEVHLDCCLLRKMTLKRYLTDVM